MKLNQPKIIVKPRQPEPTSDTRQYPRPGVQVPISQRAPVAPPQQPASAKTIGELNPDLIPIELPSNFVPYTFKALSVRKIKATHQSKFALAARKKSVKILAETISSLLEGASAYDLTTQDFRWLLYYLRQTQYLTVPLMITTYCHDEAHLLKVQEGQLPPESLKNIGTLNKSLFEEKALEEKHLREYIAGEPFLGKTRLGFQTLRDTIEMLQMEEDAEDPDDVQGDLWLAELACYLSRVDEAGNEIPLKTRMEVVGELYPDDVAALQKYAIWASDYGVSEFIRMPCKECGAEIVDKFHLSASVFL